MSNIPNDLKYTNSHEWLKLDADGSATIGITDHAQSLLGDLVFVELPDPGAVERSNEVAVVESVKAAADVYSPVSGDILEVNAALADNPDLVNSDPYGEGWLFRIMPTDKDELNDLLDAVTYQQRVAAEAH